MRLSGPPSRTPQWIVATTSVVAMWLAGCASGDPVASGVARVGLGADPAGRCTELLAPIPASDIAIPSGSARVESALLVAATPLSVDERGSTPALRIVPAVPDHCRVIGAIDPIDPRAPAVGFQVNLPLQWNGRLVQYGGQPGASRSAGLSLLPAARYDVPAPLAQGYMTAAALAPNDGRRAEAGHLSAKKLRDVAALLAWRAYDRRPVRHYFAGSSEGGRDGLTLAARYPEDFNGIFSHVITSRNLTATGDAAAPLDLSLFVARGGKLLMLDSLPGQARSAGGGGADYLTVVEPLGRPVLDRFLKVYLAGGDAPGNADMLGALVDWAERGKPPGALQLVDQETKPPFAVTRTRLVCDWPREPRFKGGDAAQAASFECAP